MIYYVGFESTKFVYLAYFDVFSMVIKISINTASLINEGAINLIRIGVIGFDFCNLEAEKIGAFDAWA